MKKYNISNKDLTIFFVVTFGLTTIMGLVMSSVYSSDLVDGYSLVQMYYPALGAMTALLLNKESRKKVPKEFYGAYIFFSVISIIYLLVKTCILHQDPYSQLETLATIGSVVLIVAYVVDKEESLESFGLKFNKNYKNSILCVFIFIILYLGTIFVPSLLFGELDEFISPFRNMSTWISLFFLPISFPLSFIMFLGEEYGWRYFLQPALQERLGKRKGIIVLGLIWGIWHFPINLFYYSPQTPFHSVLNQLVGCVAYSVFWGFVYMKTKNIWSVSMIHFLNNNLIYILYGGTGTDIVLTWQVVLINLVFSAIFYLPFLLTKEYMKKINDNVVL